MAPSTAATPPALATAVARCSCARLSKPASSPRSAVVSATSASTARFSASPSHDIAASMTFPSDIEGATVNAGSFTTTRNSSRSFNSCERSMDQAARSASIAARSAWSMRSSCRRISPAVSRDDSAVTKDSAVTEFATSATVASATASIAAASACSSSTLGSSAILSSAMDRFFAGVFGPLLSLTAATDASPVFPDTPDPPGTPASSAISSIVPDASPDAVVSPGVSVSVFRAVSVLSSAEEVLASCVSLSSARFRFRDGENQPVSFRAGAPLPLARASFLSCSISTALLFMAASSAMFLARKASAAICMETW
mmetsp:Transcript_3846/g.10447  ORF Transcript_3846/g.10447 Transcript_3846/m.10447 type:complete len:313 (+) Transcript_3846:194-1132(+)